MCSINVCLSARRDTLTEHAGFWNERKIETLAASLAKQYKKVFFSTTYRTVPSCNLNQMRSISLREIGAKLHVIKQQCGAANNLVLLEWLSSVSCAIIRERQVFICCQYLVLVQYLGNFHTVSFRSFFILQTQEKICNLNNEKTRLLASAGVKIDDKLIEDWEMEFKTKSEGMWI